MVSHWLLAHQAGAAHAGDEFVALIDRTVLEKDHARIGPRARFALVDDFRLHVDRVSMEYRFRKLYLVKAEVGNRRPQRRIRDREAYRKAQREEAIHQPLTKLGLFGEFFIEMERLGIHRQGGEQDVVGFGNRSSRLMFEDLSDDKFLKILPGHSSSVSS